VVGFNECRREPVVLNGRKGGPQERVYDNLESLILWGLAWAKGFSPCGLSQSRGGSSQLPLGLLLW
jgi:hypothetical protein